MDGRDTGPNSGLAFIQELQKQMDEIGIGKIASLSGRYYAMDRDKRWERIQLAYDAMVEGTGVKDHRPRRSAETVLHQRTSPTNSSSR